MKFSMAMATLVVANAIAAYEVPNDNTIAKLAAGYEGKKPGSEGSVRGSVQEFAADDEACFAAKKEVFVEIYGCVGMKADPHSSMSAWESFKEWGECLGKVKTVQDCDACNAEDSKYAAELKPLVIACANELENSEEVAKAKKDCAGLASSSSSFMTLMDSGVFCAKPWFEAKAFEAFYDTYSYSASEDEDEFSDEDEDEEYWDM